MSATPTSTPAPSHSTIRRAAEDRLLVGVCGGLAKSFAVPALAVRLGAIALAVPAAPFVLTTYAVLAVVVPREDGRTLLGGTPNDPRENVIGWGIVALAAVVLLATGIDGHSGPFIDPFMVFFGAVAALAVAALTTRRVAAAESPGGPPRWTAASAPAAGTGTATASQERPVPLGDEPTFVQPTQPTEPTVRLPLGPPPPPRPRLRGPSLLLVGFATIVLGTGLAAALLAAGLIDPSAGPVAAVLGGGAVAAAAGSIAFHRRRHAPGLLVLGVLLAGTATATAALGDELDRGVGSRTYRPVTAAEIQPEYRLGIGELVIDLRDTKLPRGTTTVHADLGAGLITVRVPEGVHVQDTGPTEVDGVDGVNELTASAAGSDRNTRSDRRPRRTVVIDADVQFGEAEVWSGR